jgi:hypothetical protein
MLTTTLANRPDTGTKTTRSTRTVIYAVPGAPGEFGTSTDPVPARRDGDPATRWLVRVVQPQFPTPSPVNWIMRCTAHDTKTGLAVCFRLNSDALCFAPKGFRRQLALVGAKMGLSEAAEHQKSIALQMVMFAMRFPEAEVLKLHTQSRSRAPIAFEGSAGFYPTDKPEPELAIAPGDYTVKGCLFAAPVLPDWASVDKRW